MVGMKDLLVIVRSNDPVAPEQQLLLRFEVASPRGSAGPERPGPNQRFPVPAAEAFVSTPRASINRSVQTHGCASQQQDWLSVASVSI